MNLFSTSYSSPSDGDSIRRLAGELLKQKSHVLYALSDEDYIKNCPSIFNASIASHIRHSLNHFQSLLTAHHQNKSQQCSVVRVREDQSISSRNNSNASSLAACTSSIVNYDERQRNTAIETSRAAAITAVDDMMTVIPTLTLSLPVQMSFNGDVSTNFQPYNGSSNIARELSIVTHHGVHHMAMIKLIMQQLRYDLSGSNIGVAMSTIKHQRDTTHCQQQLDNTKTGVAIAR